MHHPARPVHLIRVKRAHGASVTLDVVRQLLLYGFAADATFEGQLVGALERLESGGALRILDVLFVRRDPESGDIDAIDLHGDGAGGW